MNAKRKVLVLLSISFSAAIVIFLLTPALMKDTYRIEESITIKASPETVYNNIRNLNSWKAWSPWFNKNSDLDFLETETSLRWTSPTSEKKTGRIEFLNGTEHSNLQLRVVLEGYDSESNPVFNISETSEGTKVTITDSAEIPYFMRYFALEEAISAQYKNGLKSLKKYSE